MKTDKELQDLENFVNLLEDGLMNRLPGLSFSKTCVMAGIRNPALFNDALVEYFGYSGAEIMDFYRG
ncbi:MAG: hypothetical protein MJY67_04995 [Bacteroidales bacterium]|nr:hypothetical protein [Bacteroidales bacterium]